jgi:hypothetical protein
MQRRVHGEDEEATRVAMAVLEMMERDAGV